MQVFEIELRTGRRFDFGGNWQKFISEIGESEIAQASSSLLGSLNVNSLAGKSFLDVGSGSGLSSLAARQSGARVVSFDFDPRSVACTEAMRGRSGASDAEWRVVSGSILDSEFVASLGKFDVVYSWGVLHHTGAMWRALDLTMTCVAPGGQLLIALYNDQGVISRYWKCVKRTYNKSRFHAGMIFTLHAPYFMGARLVGNVARLARRRPRRTRGMRFWRDLVDWLGGYPFEVASLHEVEQYVESKGFIVRNIKSVGRRNGCNEWVCHRAD